MRSYRRMVLIDRLVPLLAAAVGLVALGGAVLVQMSTAEMATAMTDQLASVKGSIAALSARADALAKADDDGTAEGLLALQDRMNKLEATIQEAARVSLQNQQANPAGLTPSGQLATAGATAGTVATGGDCIPLGMRFMVQRGDSFPICGAPVKVTVTDVSSAGVAVVGAGTLSALGTGALGKCQINVFSAEDSGFAEMRVTCPE